MVVNYFANSNLSISSFFDKTCPFYRTKMKQFPRTLLWSVCLPLLCDFSDADNLINDHWLVRTTIFWVSHEILLNLFSELFGEFGKIFHGTLWYLFISIYWWALNTLTSLSTQVCCTQFKHCCTWWMLLLSFISCVYLIAVVSHVCYGCCRG